MDYFDSMNITEQKVKRLISTVDAGLCRGLGDPSPGNMCVEAAVCYALGLPHSDDPGCVSPALRLLKIQLNDLGGWSNNAARGCGMRKLAVYQLGSKGALDEVEFARRVVKLTIQTVLPPTLIAAGFPTEAARCKLEGTVEAAEAAAHATAAFALANPHVHWAVGWAVWATSAVARAWVIPARAAETAARVAGGAARVAGVNANQTLSDFADGVAAILEDMNAPGCKWKALL